MSSVFIYLDESGDLGWSFDAPYRQGGSSRFLTISAVVIPKEKLHLLGRVIKSIYIHFNWNTKKEKKWSGMNDHHRMAFAKEIKKLLFQNHDIKLYSITTYKPKVQAHIRRDANKLYNYMIYVMLGNEMALHKEVVFIPDPRSIKVESGNSLHDYLCTQLYFEKNASTHLLTIPKDSCSDKGVQFADMLSGLVQQHFEDKKSEPYSYIRAHVSTQTLFFTPVVKSKFEQYSFVEEIETI